MSILKATPVRFTPAKYPSRPTDVPPHMPGVIVGEYVPVPGGYQDELVVRINWSAVGG